jgi:hypothetical protein
MAAGFLQAKNPMELRELAAWYREFAERAGNPVIWDCRLRMADYLEEEAEQLEKTRARLGAASP